VYLFFVYLTTLFQSLRLCSVEWRDDKWMRNWKESRRKRSWLILRFYSGIYLEGLREIMKALSQDSRFPGRDLNWGLSRIWSKNVNHSTTTFDRILYWEIQWVSVIHVGFRKIGHYVECCQRLHETIRQILHYYSFIPTFIEDSFYALSCYGYLQYTQNVRFKTQPSFTS
jgi:hypothetical protein